MNIQAAPTLEERQKLRAEVGQTALSAYVTDIFQSFKTARIPFEEIWEECWYNYLGQYQPHLVWKRKTEGKKRRSRIFIKMTSLKCNTAHSKIIDLYSGKGGVPFDATPVNAEELGLDADTAKDLAEKRKQRLKNHFRKIELEERFDTGLLELAILGTAVLKGPIVETRKVPRVKRRTISGIPVDQINPDVNPYEIYYTYESLPVYDHIPLWEYYVDVNAKSNADSIGEIHFQRLLPAQFRRFAYQGGYIKDNVREAARRATANDPDDKRYIQLADNYMGSQGEKDIRVSVLEYQGLVPVSLLKDAGVDVPADVDEEDSLEAIVVLASDGIVIKACVNPGKRQFKVCPYKKRPHSIYGQGVAEAMRDSQKMINSGARLFIDNKALSGNGMVGINLDRINTKRTKDLEVYPGKTWYVKGNFSPQDAIGSVSFPDITMGLLQLIELFERFADEETNIPKYTHGEQNSFLNKTAAGMSMLMTQANINIKTVTKNIDDYWIEPIVEDTDAWFSEFADDSIGKLPMLMKATGTDSLVAKEIKMENYMKFLQITSNPQDAIFMDRVKMMKAIARLLETEDVMRTDQEIKGIVDEMSAQARMPKNLREIVSIDKLYPQLSRNEQVQVLKELGIEPDMNIQSMPGPLTNGGSTSLSPTDRAAGGPVTGGRPSLESQGATVMA